LAKAPGDAAVEALSDGEATKFVLLDNKNDMRAVLLTPESYSEMLACCPGRANARAA